jgi:hypothetical protein
MNVNKTVSITVLHFYNHPILYPFMTQSLFEIPEDAFRHNERVVEVPKDEFEYMITTYLDTLKN